MIFYILKYKKYNKYILIIKNMTDYSNFLLILIIVSISMFILLCPRKQVSQRNEKFNYPTTEFISYNYNTQYLSNDIVPEGQEYNKSLNIQKMNMDYNTRGDINDLINLNQIPNEGSMFVYP
jgi:hypothetical protein